MPIFIIPFFNSHKLEPHEGVEPSLLLYQNSLLPLTPKRQIWSQLSESNRRQAVYKTAALPTELNWQIGRFGGTRTHILFQLCVNRFEGGTNTNPIKNHSSVLRLPLLDALVHQPIAGSIHLYRGLCHHNTLNNFYLVLLELASHNLYNNYYP